MSPSEALLDLLDRISCGAVLLDDEGKIAGFNDTAQSHLRELCELHGEPIRNDGWARDLLRQLEHFTTHRRGLSPPSKQVSRRKGRPLIAYMWSYPWSNDDGPKPVLILIDLDQASEPGEALLRQLFGLTGAEAKLAVHMAGGRSLDEIASELRISISTARTQLRSIFAKTRTHRQAELVALLNRAGLLRLDGRLSELDDLNRLLRRQASASPLDSSKRMGG